MFLAFAQLIPRRPTTAVSALAPQRAEQAPDSREDLTMIHTALCFPRRGRFAAPQASARRATRSRVGAMLTLAIALWLAPASAFAGAAFVKNIGTNSSESTGSSLAVTVPAGGVAANDTIIVTLAMDPAADSTDLAHPAGVTDSMGNTYAKDADVTIGSGTSGVRTVVFSAPVGTALVSGNTITVTHPSVAARAVSINEFSGLLTSSPTDQSGTATNTTSPLSATTSGAISQIQELGIGAFGREGKLTDFTAVGSGFTGLTRFSSGNSGSTDTHITIDPEFKVLTNGSGTQTADETSSVGENWAAAVVTYKSVPTTTPTPTLSATPTPTLTPTP